MIKILFVCMGNICRSPTAHAVMQNKISTQGLSALILADSAGTHAYHVNEPPDSRAVALANAKGIGMDSIRARKIAINDYDDFDYILAMDDDNLELLNYYAPQNHAAEIRLFLSFINASSGEKTIVPDPYYGGDLGFSTVFDLVDQGCDALIEHLLQH